MLEFSKKTNQLMQSKYKYQLQEVEEPNLYREIFDYEAIPKIAFNNRLVPINMPADIWMTDTAFRDGQPGKAIANVVVNMVLCLCGTAFGFFLMVQ